MALLCTRNSVIAAVLLLAVCSAAAIDAYDFADIYVRSRELPSEREFLSGISFQLHRNNRRRTVTTTNSTFESHHSLTLSFRALEHDFEATLHHNAELWHPNAVVTVLDDGDLIDTFSPSSNAYMGEATILPASSAQKREKRVASVSAVVVDYEKGIFHMSINDEANGESFLVEPTYLHPTLSKRSDEESAVDFLGNNMVVFKENLDELGVFNPQQTQEREADEEEEGHCGNDDAEEQDEDQDEAEDSFGDVSPTSRCPPSRSSYLLMGVATDNQYVRKAGGVTATRHLVSWIFNNMQRHYYRAVRNKPVLKSLVIHSSPSSSSSSAYRFNTARCPSNVQSRLSPFCSWRARQSDRSIGLWHLLSGCLPDRSGVAGRAYYSALCRHTTRGCGITGYLGGNARWVIPAHEIGHNFGARHSSNIMAPSVNSRATGFSGTSVRQMCYYTFRNRYRTQCLLSSLPSGGFPDYHDDDDDDNGGHCECRTEMTNNKQEESAAASLTAFSF
ncbi:Metallo-peptidase family M12-domain-containing protein [Balamuthia mandrillaris]